MTVTPPLLEMEICCILAKTLPPDVDTILTIDTDGISIAKFVGAILGIPVLVAKEFHYDQNCLEFTQRAAYHERTMYIPAAVRNKHVAFIDAVVSSGGTALEIINTLESNTSTLAGVFTVFNKPKLAGFKKIINTGHEFVAIADVTINNGFTETTVSSQLKHMHIN
jgi:adenine/guanine phosphoribosyltransferase-like PRPP-binding protein